MVCQKVPTLRTLTSKADSGLEVGTEKRALIMTPVAHTQTNTHDSTGLLLVLVSESSRPHADMSCCSRATVPRMGTTTLEARTWINAHLEETETTTRWRLCN